MIWGRLILFGTFNNSIVILILCIRILQYYAVISVCVGFDILYDFYPKHFSCFNLCGFHLIESSQIKRPSLY